MTWTGGPPTGPRFLEAPLRRDTELVVETAAVDLHVGDDHAGAAVVVGGSGRDDASSSLQHRFAAQSP